MDWLNFGEVDLINTSPAPPPNQDDDDLDMFTFLSEDFSSNDPESISSRLKSKVIENDGITEISHNDIVDPRVEASFGDPEFQDNDVADMYKSLLSNDVPAHPSDSPFFEMEKVTEVTGNTKSSPVIDGSTRGFLEAIESFLTNSNNNNRSFCNRDIKSSPKGVLIDDQSSNLSLFKSRDSVNQNDGINLKEQMLEKEECCDKPLGNIIPKEEEMTNEDGIQFEKSSKDTFRISNISEFVDRTNGRNIIILIADNQNQPHDPGKYPISGVSSESFEISSSSHIQQLNGVEGGSSPSKEQNNAKCDDDANVANLTTGTQFQISNQVGESLSPSQCPDEPAQDKLNELITFPRIAASMALTSSSSSSSSSCSSSPKSFHFNKSPQIILGPSNLESPLPQEQQRRHLILSPQQLKSPSSPPLPLILPKRGKRTLQERRKIKKWQNIEAARRYRDRKKLEMETSITQVKILEAANKQLYEKMDALQNKVSNLKKILTRLGLLT